MNRMSGYDGGWSNSNVPQQYQLSAEQMTRVRDIRSQYDDKIIPLQRELRALRLEANGYATRSGADMGKIKSYRKDIRDLEDDIADLRLDARADISKVLTKEQRVYFGDRYDWWGMDEDMTGNMMYDMGSHRDCRMMSDRWGW